MAVIPSSVLPAASMSAFASAVTTAFAFQERAVLLHVSIFTTIYALDITVLSASAPTAVPASSASR